MSESKVLVTLPFERGSSPYEAFLHFLLELRVQGINAEYEEMPCEKCLHYCGKDNCDERE